MDGYNFRGGTPHSALARSHERQLAKERSIAAIETPQPKVEVTFSRVLDILRNDHTLEALPGGIFRATIARGYGWSILYLLNNVEAPITRNEKTGDHVIIEFAQHAPVIDTTLTECALCGEYTCDCVTVEEIEVCAACITPEWLPDEILMLPAVCPIHNPDPPVNTINGEGVLYIPPREPILIPAFAASLHPGRKPGVTLEDLRLRREAYKTNAQRAAEKRMKAQVEADRLERQRRAVQPNLALMPKKLRAFLESNPDELERYTRARANLNARTNQIDPETILAAGRKNAAAARANAKHTRSTGQRHNGRTVLGSV